MVNPFGLCDFGKKHMRDFTNNCLLGGLFSYEGKTTLHKKVPDTITSWVITGFAIDPITGFGMTQNPRTLNVFQPFFVSTNLPYSVKRGEVVSIPIVVFNYMENDVQAEVTLENVNQEFDFTEITNEVNPNPSKYLNLKTN